jgi:hypothetical protein
LGHAKVPFVMEKMKNIQGYNQFVQALEKTAGSGLFFHRINTQIYITDYNNRLLGIWDLPQGCTIDWKDNPSP